MSCRERFLFVWVRSIFILVSLHTITRTPTLTGTTRFTPHVVSRRPLVRVLKSRVSDSSPSGLVGTGGLRLDIERLFAKKLRIFGDVHMDRESLTSAILRLVLKTYFECVRITHFCRSSLTRSTLTIILEHTGTSSQTLEKRISTNIYRRTFSSSSHASLRSRN